MNPKKEMIKKVLRAHRQSCHKEEKGRHKVEKERHKVERHKMERGGVKKAVSVSSVLLQRSPLGS